MTRTNRKPTSFLDLPAEIRQIILRHAHNHLSRNLIRQMNKVKNISKKRAPLKTHPLIIEFEQNAAVLPLGKFMRLSHLLQQAGIIKSIGSPLTPLHIALYERQRHNEENLSYTHQFGEIYQNNRTLRSMASKTSEDLEWFKNEVKAIAPQAVDDLEFGMEKELQELLVEMGKMADFLEKEYNMTEEDGVREAHKQLMKRLESFLASKEMEISGQQAASI